MDGAHLKLSFSFQAGLVVCHMTQVCSVCPETDSRAKGCVARSDPLRFTA